MVEVWGIAAGWGSTESAAPGAFTVRTYASTEDAEDALRDWRQVLIRKEERES